MIADDTSSIRKALELLDWRKRAVEAEANLKAQQGDKTVPAALPTPKPMLNEPGAPYFRGVFLEGLEPPVRGIDSNFNFDQDAWDAWDDATLDSDVTADANQMRFMWGMLD